MSDIQVTSSSTLTTSSTTRGPAKAQQQPQALPASNSTGQSISLSSEAQYLFDVDKYLSKLNPEELDKALEYLLQSDDPLQIKAAGHFKQGQEYLSNVLGGKPPVLVGQLPPEKGENLLNTGLVIDGTTEIALLPPGVDVFRLDGKSNFSPVIFGGHNTALNNELESLEARSKGVLGNKDHANLFGSVRNALVYSENIMLSFDDVLHFNYAIEKAREAIDFIDAPSEMKNRLTDILNQSITYQNGKQTQALSDSREFVGDNRVGNIANENIRLGTAAQRLNGQLQGALGRSNESILNSQDLMNRLLTDNPELIRFSPNKIDEAISYYQKDYEKFERALNGELSIPSVLKTPDMDSEALEIGSNYALKVIQNIQHYGSI